MGYELKIYVGRIGSSDNWFKIIGMIDINKPVHNSEIANLNVTGIPVFFYGTDGNTEIRKDKYGERLQAILIEYAIAALEKDVNKSNYVYLKIALEFLKSVESNLKYEGLKVILFGY